MKLHILKCGEVRVDISLPFSNESSHPFSYTGLFRAKKYQVWLPVFAFLLEHKKGLILFDTGWGRENSPNGKYDAPAQIRHLGLMHYMLNKAYVPSGEAIIEQLESLRVRQSDIDYLLLSHLHSDHTSGLKSVRGARQILCSDIELNDTRKYAYRYVPSMWDGVDIETFSFEENGFGPVGKSRDFFGDGSLILVNIPGHTNGMFAALIFIESKYILLYFDGGYATKSWKEMIAPGTALDKNLAYKSLEWIAKMSKDSNCIKSFASHDVDIKPQVIEF